MSKREIERPYERSLLDQEWSVWLDEAARWEDDDLDSLTRLPEREPSGGWSILEQGLPIRLPATTHDVSPRYRGVSWWSTEFELVEDRAFLQFLGVRLLAEVYLDRRRIHLDLEGMTPFEVALPVHISPGRHRLDLRVTNPGGGDNWEDYEPVEWGSFRLPASHGFGGPWLPIHLEQPGAVRVADLWATGDRELGAALVNFELEATRPCRLRVEITGPSGGVAEHDWEASPGHQSLALPLSAVDLYWPGRPNLHTCRILHAGTLVGEVDFGLRMLDFADDALRLNGEPFRMSTSISWGWYRRGPVPSEGDCEREANSVLAFGMNTLSAHRHPSTPELQDALEERGLVLYQEAGGIGTGIRSVLDDRERARIERLAILRLRRLARRDRGRACLGWWNVANEMQGSHLAAHGEHFARAVSALREEDPTRLVTVTSGWGSTDMWRPFDGARQASWDWHRIWAWPSAWTDEDAAFVERFQPEGVGLSIDGESSAYGGIGKLHEILDSFGDDAPTEGDRGRWQSWVNSLEEGLQRADPDGVLGGLPRVCDGTAAVQAHAFARLIEAHRRVGGIHGLATNGWNQHPTIGTSGIVAPDRSPVIDPEPLRRANAPKALALSELRRAVRVGENPVPRVELLTPTGTSTTVDAQIELEFDGTVVWRGESRNRMPFASAGLHKIRARFEDLVVEDAVLAVAAPDLTDRSVAVLDAHPELLEWLNGHGVRAQRWRIGSDLPLLLVGANPFSGGLPETFLPRRVAMIQRAFGPGQVPYASVFDGVSLLERRAAGAPSWMDVHGSWIGGWAFSPSSFLPGLGPPGVWGSERSSIYPRLAKRNAPGKWLAGAISFPDASLYDPGVPAIGATAWLVDDGGTEFLTTVLPLIERLLDPIGGAVVLDLVDWLTRD